MPNLLLFRGSPRSNIPEVEEQNEKLSCDKLIIRYTPEYQAYKQARDFFLSHTEYDYLILATDDIVVKPEHVKLLRKDLEAGESIGVRILVLSGIMNVDQPEYMKDDGNLNICHELAIKDRKLRHYNWIKRKDLPDKEIFQVKFSGFPLMAIHRSIVERTPFAADGVFKGKGMEFGASLDFVFCWWCHENQIPVFVDKRIDMQHLRVSGEHMTGKISPKVHYWKYQEEPIRIKA